MPAFSERSLENLATCDERLRRVAHRAIKKIDFAVICGHRGEVDQERAFQEKRSKARWGESPHNFEPALAFDLVPYPVEWKRRDRFYEMAAVVLYCAKLEGVELVWGGDWKMQDLPHFELKGWKAGNAP